MSKAKDRDETAPEGETEERSDAPAAEAVPSRWLTGDPLGRWMAEESPWWPAWFGRRLPERLFGEAGHFFDQMKIEEYVDDDAFVVRAEIPGVDPDEDIDIAVEGGRLSIRAERSSKTESEGEGFRSEFRYGSFSRVLTLPEGVEVDDIDATYVDGILEIRIPLPDEGERQATKIPIGRR